MKRVNIVTLGVRDLAKSKRFFNGLFDWKPMKNGNEAIAFYDMGGWVFALYPWDLLAEDAAANSSPKGEGFPGITLAHNVREKEDVAKVLDQARKLGAKIIKPAQDVFWGGHSGYFMDLDGHYWEVAWNPFMPTLPDGTLDTQSVS